MSERPPGTEFELIARYFAPLAAGEAGAFGLTDDAAALKIPSGRELVVTKDMLAAGVHFFANDPPETISRKLLRVNLSDLAAMGAAPRAYALGLALPAEVSGDWLERFAAGLARDQAEYAVSLIGGDTIRAAGPLTLSLTAFGEVAEGRALRRSGAKAGDDIYVSGTIGDAALGLAVAEGGLEALPAAAREHLLTRYRLPEPRVVLGPRLIGLAHAAADISDGLAADLGHIAAASGVGGRIEIARVPLSEPARAALVEEPALMSRILSGGDDYELLIAAPPDAAEGLVAAARAAGVALTRIGGVTDEPGVRFFSSDGAELALASAGYAHF
jgi:thiamine-monophosphate kinase